MNRLNDIQRARLLELAVERATAGISNDELRSLEILAGTDAGRLDDSFERAAAAVHLASLPDVDPLPRELAASIAADADRFFAPQRGASGETAARARPAATQPAWFGWSGWVAAAACFVAVIGLLVMQKATNRGAAEPMIAGASGVADESADEPAADVAPPSGQASTRAVAQRPSPGRADDRGSADAEEPVSAADQRLALLQGQRFVLRRAWVPAGDSSGIGVQGDVVWDARNQTGYLRFTRLRRNDPSQEQYQLWIFDGQRDQRYPVDGGVFDSDGAEELVVPIQARLPVGTPLAFAVTVERRGGVVVSDRQRVVVIARMT